MGQPKKKTPMMTKSGGMLMAQMGQKNLTHPLQPKPHVSHSSGRLPLCWVLEKTRFVETLAHLRQKVMKQLAMTEHGGTMTAQMRQNNQLLHQQIPPPRLT